MSGILPNTAPATLRDTLADVSGRPVKAGLHPHTPAHRLREIAAEALRRTTSQKAAALDIGVTDGRLSHKLQDGSLTLVQLEALEPAFGAELGRLLVEHYGPLSTPQARIRQKVRELRAIADELDQAAELVA